MAYSKKYRLTPEDLMGRKADKYNTNEAGDTTGYKFSGTVPGGLMGLFGNMFGGQKYESPTSNIDYGEGTSSEYGQTGDVTGEGYSDETGTYNEMGLQESTPDNSLNPSNQPINNISSAASQGDYTQQDLSRAQSYKDKNWAMDDTINQDAWASLNQPQDNTVPSLGRDAEAEAFGTGTPFENPYTGETSEMLERQMDRLKLEGKDRESFLTNMSKFSDDTRMMESDDNPLAVNIPQEGQEQTSARGAYQFTKGSVDTGKQRMKNLGYSDEYLSDLSDDPTEWDPEQANAMFMSNVMAQTGSDEYLRGIGAGDQGKYGAREAYYKFHHTAPDEATTKRAQDYFL